MTYGRTRSLKRLLDVQIGCKAMSNAYKDTTTWGGKNLISPSQYHLKSALHIASRHRADVGWLVLTHHLLSLYRYLAFLRKPSYFVSQPNYHVQGDNNPKKGSFVKNNVFSSFLWDELINILLKMVWLRDRIICLSREQCTFTGDEKVLLGEMSTVNLV